LAKIVFINFFVLIFKRKALKYINLIILGLIIDKLSFLIIITENITINIK